VHANGQQWTPATSDSRSTTVEARSGGQGVASSNLASPTKPIHPNRPSRTCIQPTFLPPSIAPSDGRSGPVCSVRSATDGASIRLPRSHCLPPVIVSAHEVVALWPSSRPWVIACDGSATSGGTYQSDTVLDSAEDAQPPTPRQVVRECVREVRPEMGGREMWRRVPSGLNSIWCHSLLCPYGQE
jgi:hypothetical protein